VSVNLQREANFLERPHDRLYPCVWGDDEQMRPEARERLTSAVLDLLEARWPDARQWVRFAVIGSGASYNWDETGDIDFQIWVADAEALPQVRHLIVDNLMHLTCADFGLATADYPGTMEVQFYAKAGRGTEAENLSGQPYACYDVDLGRWLVKPIPLTPELYGNLFLLVEPRAQQVADEAERLLGDYDRARASADYWVALNGISLANGSPAFEERAQVARAALVQAHAGVKALFKQVFRDRQDAYTPTGKGIYDERDAVVKLLEVWGIFDRLKHIGQGRPGVAG
jgi:hypothetical protein